MRQTTLRPGDIPVAYQLLLTPAASYSELAQRIHLSVGEAHNAVKRLALSGLVSRATRRVNRRAFYDLLTSGVPYVFPAQPGPDARGVPTAHAAEPLASLIVSDEAFVWPSAKGTKRGQSISPLYAGAPETAADNLELYRFLVLTDALRVGRARERKLAAEFLQKAILESKTE